MYKVTPNPPRSLNAETIDPKAADRALSHYLPQDNPPERSNITAKRGGSQSREETLINASSILDSAAATAYENANNLTAPHRKVAMGVVHLIELAQRQMDSLLEEESPSVTN
ncbi:hypothetical protein HX882_02215 [Pseudomonas gingeri]|uniref:DUF3077 domain-containing protein n=1 Tax=Pseudomonas gingeri TaxID=117681 RepID=A0A7Y7X7G7_9PSED|nr:hypothetical protein [Pseudomonas gingeri]NWA23803.1 hypothetical protein [Pseudomonas gingeri]NWB94703.1 hypothetical protein [Pseudomonas gingeri]